MTKLGELARLIRSKNAGPFVLTFDIMFDSKRAFECVKSAEVLSPQQLSRILKVPEADIAIFVVEQALAFKISIPRPYFQGDLLDGDCHGGQQYAPLIDIEVPDVRELL